MLVHGDDAISLARTYKNGDRDVYRMRVSEVGKLAPLGNAIEVAVGAQNEQGQGLVVFLTYANPAPNVRLATLARWIPSPTGAPKEVLQTLEGYEFAPWAFVQNASRLKEKQVEKLPAGSVRMVSIKDSVAKLRAWMQIGGGMVVDSTSVVEIPTRKPNTIQGKVYRQEGRKLIPVRAFTFERVRTKAGAPIAQPEDELMQ